MTSYGVWRCDQCKHETLVERSPVSGFGEKKIGTRLGVLVMHYCAPRCLDAYLEENGELLRSVGAQV